MKILIFQEKLPHYRVDIFNEIASRPNIDLTLVYTVKQNSPSNNKFNEIIVPYKKLGPFKIAKDLNTHINYADYVILMFDLRWLYIYRYIFSSKREKITLWGIGISSAKGLKEKRIIDLIRFYIVSRYKSLILYSSGVADYYLKNGVDKSKVFIANNTLKVDEIGEFSYQPKDILFIGTINKRKKLDDLILAFLNILPKLDDDVKLNIVGDGEMLDEYKNLVKQNNINNRIVFHGRIESQEELKLLFSKTKLSISLGQAGLSILHSFSFGVPFMSYDDAINGGELENIENGITGIITNPEKLEKDLVGIINSPEHLKIMSNNCYNLYWKTRTVEQFADKFLNAFT